MLRQKPAYSYHQSYTRLISTVNVTINYLILLRPSPRPFLSKTAAMTPLKNCCLWYQNHQTPCPLAKPPTKRLKRRKRGNIAKRRLGRTLVPWLSVLMQLILLAGLAIVEIKKMQVTLSITTIITSGILQGTVLNLEKSRALQKTSIGLSHLCSND